MLQVEGLIKSYPTFRLESISFSLKEGAVTGLIGRNGAGKSTTIKAVLGFICPDAGTVRFFGGSMDELQTRQRIGYVGGGFMYYPRKRLKDITAVTRSFYKASWDDQVYSTCLRRFQLDERKTPSQLSEGMKVKYALALALSHRAQLLILDEPTSGLDPVSRDEVLDVLLELRDEGATLLYSTHIISDLEKCADHLLYLQQGKLLADDTPQAIRKQYRLVRMKQLAQDARLIGPRRNQEGYSALIHTYDEHAFPQSCETDLETVMLHLEKEAMTE